MRRDGGGVTVTVLSLFFASALAAAENDIPRPPKVSAQEPAAKELSLARAAGYLDSTSIHWTRDHKCGSCHTNYPYLMARPFLREAPGRAYDEVRRFFETRAARWDSGDAKDKPRWDTEVVATAVALAVSDAHTTGRLHAQTRRALDKMWTLQRPNGAWDWIKCGWPPM